MRFKARLRRLIEKTGYSVSRAPNWGPVATYDKDGLRTVHNHEFMLDPAFKRAKLDSFLLENFDSRQFARLGLGDAYAAFGKSMESTKPVCGREGWS